MSFVQNFLHLGYLLHDTINWQWKHYCNVDMTHRCQYSRSATVQFCKLIKRKMWHCHILHYILWSIQCLYYYDYVDSRHSLKSLLCITSFFCRLSIGQCTKGELYSLTIAGILSICKYCIYTFRLVTVTKLSYCAHSCSLIGFYGTSS